MRLTLIHPCIGRRPGQDYVKTWQMEPLPPAAIAGLTPPGIEIAFYDDRMEPIPYDRPTDLAAISIETYTAKRAYQIASEYRRRGVPVVMGGFHATLCPLEAARYAEAVVIGEAEGLWTRVLEDAARGALQPYYRSSQRPSLAGLLPDRSIYAGKRYLPLALAETTRGCRFECDFCAIQSFFDSTHNVRPIDDVVAEVEALDKPLIFFVDDNLTSNVNYAKELLHALIPLKVRWVGQITVNAVHDSELLELMAASGCQGVLIGFESLNAENLAEMNKGFNATKGGFEQALANLRQHKIKLYITFVFGYDCDTADSLWETVQFAIAHRFYLAAFNHLTPFPGTPLYKRLEAEGRLLYRKWWLDDGYGYNKIPFQPARMTPERLQSECVRARAAFFSWRNIWRRGLSPVNRAHPLMWLSYYWINYLFHREVTQRDDYPLGDQAWRGELIAVREEPPPVPASAPAG
ncbi:MAG: radical SAM protein [Anaerolineae bacterium]|nr:MAG: radical SAM protein [Anaerolineae bacterium]